MLAVRVVPRAGRTGVAGTRGDALLVRLAAAPVDGAANDALVAFLADVVRSARGATSRSSPATRRATSAIAIAGLTAAQVAARLSAILAHAAPVSAPADFIVSATSAS